MPICGRVQNPQCISGLSPLWEDERICDKLKYHLMSGLKILDMELSLSSRFADWPYHNPLVIFVWRIIFVLVCQSTFLASCCLYTRTYPHMHSILPALYFGSVFPVTYTHARNFTMHTQRVLSVVGNWSSVGPADLQTPAQQTELMGAVATRRHHAGAEEQARSSTQGEATDKQCTTSEYSKLIQNFTNHTNN